MGSHIEPPHVGDDHPPAFGSGHTTANSGGPSFDVSVPNVARIYDYLLGGKNNFAADRETAEQIVELIPDAAAAAFQNRIFLQRAVEFLAHECGIRQYIDIGTGLPTQGSVHEVAQRVIPDARVLYVDYDPMVVSHAQALLAAKPTVVAISRDLRKPDEILSHPALQALIDPREPLAILLLAVLHFVKDDEDPYEIVGTLKAAMPSGSYLVLSHVTDDEVPAAEKRQAEEVYMNASAPVTARSRTDMMRFFDGLVITEPGIADVRQWRAAPIPDERARTLMYGAVARKP